MKLTEADLVPAWHKVIPRVRGRLRPFKLYVTSDTFRERGKPESWIKWTCWASYCTLTKAHVAAVLLLMRSRTITGAKTLRCGRIEVALWRPRPRHRPPLEFIARAEGYTTIRSARQAGRIVANVLDEAARVKRGGGR